jgi:hypothetical protein
MNTTEKGIIGILTGRIAGACAAAMIIGAASLSQNAEAVVNYSYGQNYSANFDLLGPTGTDTAVIGAGSGSADWFGTQVTGFDPILSQITYGRTTTVGTTNGSTDVDGLYNIGAATGADRALGLQGQGRWVGIELFNTTQLLNEFRLNVTLEAWRVASSGASTWDLQYQVSSTQLPNLQSGNWSLLRDFSFNSADPQFNGLTPVQTVSTGGFTVNNINWGANQYLYFRLQSTSNSDSTVGFDTFEFQAVPEPSTWIAGGLLLGFAAFTQFRRRNVAAEVAA